VGSVDHNAGKRHDWTHLQNAPNHWQPFWVSLHVDFLLWSGLVQRDQLVKLVSNKLIRSLKAHENFMLIRLAQYTDANGEIHMPLEGIRWIGNLGSAAGAIAVLNKLITLGFIDKQVRPGRGNMNCYRINVGAVRKQSDLPASPEVH
jgi:hypothetical protein